jgi:protein kinase C substrate 80K-H
VTEAGALRAAHERATRKLTELSTQRDTLDKRLSANGGADGAYLALLGQCFELSEGGYTYVMCPFESARQDPGGTSLGAWGGWAEGSGPESGRPAFSFTGGLGCWNGPARSLRVDIACGASNALLRVEEPNRCEYRADFVTPAACDAAATEELLVRAAQAAEVAAAAAASVHTEL